MLSAESYGKVFAMLPTAPPEVNGMVPAAPRLDRDVKILSRWLPQNGLFWNSTCPSPYRTFWPSSPWLALLPNLITLAGELVLTSLAVHGLPVMVGTLVPGLMSEATA